VFNLSHYAEDFQTSGTNKNSFSVCEYDVIKGMWPIFTSVLIRNKTETKYNGMLNIDGNK